MSFVVVHRDPRPRGGSVLPRAGGWGALTGSEGVVPGAGAAPLPGQGAAAQAHVVSGAADEELGEEQQPAGLLHLRHPPLLGEGYLCMLCLHRGSPGGSEGSGGGGRWERLADSGWGCFHDR